jgi:hypothetical protein
MSLYTCNACGYTTTTKTSYNKHLKTKKHLKNTGQSTEEKNEGNVLNIDLDDDDDISGEINQTNVNSFFNQASESDNDSLENTETYEEYIDDSDEELENEVEPNVAEEVNIKVTKKNPDNSETTNDRIIELEYMVSELEKRLEDRIKNEKKLESKVNELNKLVDDKFKRIKNVLQTVGSNIERIEDKVDDNVDFIAGQTVFNERVLLVFKGLS